MNQILQPNKFWEKWHIFSFSKSPLIFHINPYLCEIRKIYFMHMGHREEEEKKLDDSCAISWEVLEIICAHLNIE